MGKCRCPSSYTIPAYIWVVLSTIAAILCPIGIYYPNWLVRENNGSFDSVSSFRVCLNETATSADLSCSSYLSFDQIFSPEWKAVTLLMGAGGCFLVLVALTAIFGLCVKQLFNFVVMILSLIFQALGTLLFIISLILFPAGLYVPQAKELCGLNTMRFNIGDCTIGWAYIVTMVGTFLALVATAMSWTTYKRKEKDSNIDDDRDPYMT